MAQLSNSKVESGATAEPSAAAERGAPTLRYVDRPEMPETFVAWLDQIYPEDRVEA